MCPLPTHASRHRTRYRDAYLAAKGIAVATARAGNVIGGGDWSADRLIPDAVRAWIKGDTLHIRRPSAVRPWQHVLEPPAGYLWLAETNPRSGTTSTPRCNWQDKSRRVGNEHPQTSQMGQCRTSQD